jgi:lipoprotein-anchoring transpeptidase ErfK/SrfK
MRRAIVVHALLVPALLAAAATATAASATVELQAPTATRAWTARLLAAVSARAAPARTAHVITTLQPIAPLGGGATTLLITGTRMVEGRRWVRVLLPVRPNGTQGWVPADPLAFRPVSSRVVIDQSQRRLTVYRHGRVAYSTTVAIGTTSTPTPNGRFAIAELIPTGDPGGFFGPYVLPLTGYSEKLNEYAGGNGRVALHGTSLPGLLGTRASHGCIRIGNAAIRRIAAIISTGTPVTIRP